jgi:hypothetical protein
MTIYFWKNTRFDPSVIGSKEEGDDQALREARSQFVFRAKEEGDDR